MTTLQELIKEFDKVFGVAEDKMGFAKYGQSTFYPASKLKLFIGKSYLAGKEDERKRIVEMIEGMKIAIPKFETDGEYKLWQLHAETGYNKALTDLLSAIKQDEKK
jgi:hypothetical protein